MNGFKHFLLFSLPNDVAAGWFSIPINRNALQLKLSDKIQSSQSDSLLKMLKMSKSNVPTAFRGKYTQTAQFFFY